MSKPLTVCVTGAAGQIGYSLLYTLASGYVFGESQPVILHLLDIAPAMEALGGVKMELEDCALSLLHGVVCTDDPMVAFKGADVAILVGAMPRKQGMERKDLLKANAGIFKVQGQAMNQVASKNIKVLVVGNPANTNAFITMHYAKDIPRENFTALTRLDMNRAKAQIALRLGVSVENVKNVSIWGNHSATQYPDVTHGHVEHYPNPGSKTPIEKAINDDSYLHNDFVKLVQQRGAAVIAARKQSSAMSAAKAICDHVRDWWIGTPEGEYVSMGVASDGSYGIKEGVIFSYPVTCKNGTYKIVQGLHVSEFSRKMLDLTAEELYGERDEALSFLESQ